MFPTHRGSSTSKGSTTTLWCSPGSLRWTTEVDSSRSTLSKRRRRAWQAGFEQALPGQIVFFYASISCSFCFYVAEEMWLVLITLKSFSFCKRPLEMPVWMYRPFILFCCLSSSRFAYTTVESLSPSHEYQFRVMAENLYGRSEPCEPTGVIKTDTEAEGQQEERTRWRGWDTDLLHNICDNPDRTLWNWCSIYIHITFVLQFVWNYRCTVENISVFIFKTMTATENEENTRDPSLTTTTVSVSTNTCFEFSRLGKF